MVEIESNTFCKFVLCLIVVSKISSKNENAFNKPLLHCKIKTVFDLQSPLRQRRQLFSGYMLVIYEMKSSLN